MEIDIDLVNSLKVGEFIKVSENEVLACVEWTKCEDCLFNDSIINSGCKENIDCHDGYTDLMYKLFKQKQS